MADWIWNRYLCLPKPRTQALACVTVSQGKPRNGLSPDLIDVATKQTNPGREAFAATNLHHRESACDPTHVGQARDPSTELLEHG